MKVTGTNVDQASAAQNSHVHSAHSAKKSAKAGDESAQAEVSGSSTEGAVNSEISAKGRELANAKAVATGAPDMREEKIAKLKEMIAANKYHPDPHAVADRMVDEHLSSGIG
jgi:flagellar biosynthesis anti-sigma factor FlgM